jgi:uncharacterized protein YkwD
MSGRVARIALALTALAVLPPPVAAEEAAPAARMIEAVNELRAEHGLAPYSFSEQLSRSSKEFAEWQMKNDRFGHAESIRAAGRWSSLGEAIAMHWGHRPLVHQTVRRWARSPSHAALLLSPLFTEAGAGVSHGRLGRRRATIWVLQLGRR